MIRLQIGNIDTQDNLTDYKINVSPEYAEDFSNYDGTVFRRCKGRRITVSAKLEDLSNSIAGAVAEYTFRNEFEAMYTTPVPCNAMFHLTGYDAECDDPNYNDPTFAPDGVKWNISLTMEAFEPVSDGYL